VLGLIYGIALAIMGLKFGFLIGLLSGIISFIPFVGSAFGLIASVTVAWFQFGSLDMVGIALAIFVIGQIIEGNILTPKLVGNSIQLHPLWIIFSLMAGGALFGFTGMLIALPAAAMIGVLVRFALSEYKRSDFYLQAEPEAATKTVKKAPAKTKAQTKSKAKKAAPKAKSSTKQDKSTS
jgi:predicted PurR-regulated permease PerM